MSQRFSRARSAADPAAPDRELRAAVSAARNSTARFRYRSAVADPFSAGGDLGGWEDTGLVDFAAQGVWYRRAWTARAACTEQESIGVLSPAGLVTLRPDGTASELPGALHLLNATANPLGVLRLLDPAYTTAKPTGAGRWRIQIDVEAARRVLGVAAVGAGVVHAHPVLAATAQLECGRLAVVAVQIGMWGEPHAWAAVRFSAWDTPLPQELGRADPDFARLRAALVA